jgi:hypothetical protein
MNYYPNFFKNCGQITIHLILLLKKEALSWTQEETKYFEKIKEAMCRTHVLVLPNFIKK